MQRPIALAVAAVSAVLLTLVLPATAERLDDVKARGKIIVGVSDTTPPFSFKRPGENEHVGYDIDLVRAVAKRLGVGVETVSLSSAERIPMLQQGKLDFVATSMTRTLERLREIDFSLIYFVTPHAVIVKKSSGITSVQQLAGRKAASASTSTASGNLKEVVPSVDIVNVRDYAVAFAALKDGSVDAFPTDESVLRAIVKPGRLSLPSRLRQVAQRRIRIEEGRARFQGRHQPRTPRHRGVRRGRQDLRCLVRSGVAGADAAQVQNPA